jgi:tetratricopeptide (TPR) repeat protein
VAADLTTWEQELKDARDRLEQTEAEQYAPVLQELSPSLATRVKEGTVTLDDIDEFLVAFLDISADLKGYLLFKKAQLLRYERHEEEALKYYDEALHVKESPAVWVQKGELLQHMDRIEDALQAFRRAYELREDFGFLKRQYLSHLLFNWHQAAHTIGFQGSLDQDANKFSKGVHELLDVLDKIDSEDLREISESLAHLREVLPNDFPSEIRNAHEEVGLAIRLLSIKDPFERVRELTKEVTKVWPEGVSAVEAFREQRDREWTK